MPKIRVLHFSLTDNAGGIEAYQKNVFDNADADKFEFDFVTTFSDCPLQSYYIQHGRKVHLLPPQKTILPYCISLYRLLKKEKYDILHIHKNSCANPMVFIIGRMAGIKVIIAHAHNTGATHSKIANVVHYFFRPLVRRLSHIHLSCAPEAAEWIFGKKNDALILKNGIDLPKYGFNPKVRNQVREELNIHEELLIGHVGNFIPQKNHIFILEVMEEVLKKNPKAKLLFIGKGTLLKNIEEEAVGRGIKDHIIFLTSVIFAADYYQAMDVFLFPSLHEGLPIAGIEAQASGLPTIFSDNITNEICLNDNVAVLSLERGAKAWADAVLEKYEEGRERNPISREKLLDYSIQESVKKVEKIYEDAIAGKNG